MDSSVSDGILAALKWREEHAAHVQMLEELATHWFPPSDEDFGDPELWKPGSWLWLREFWPTPPEQREDSL